MNKSIKLTLNYLQDKIKFRFPYGGYVEKDIFKDAYNSSITILTVSNGLLTYSILIERGMDIGVVHYKNEKISWERDEKFLIHPDNINLSANNGTEWIKGFYAAIASIGPELFGTPGEGYTLHGTGSYSAASIESIYIVYDHKAISVEGIVPVKSGSNQTLFSKKIIIKSSYNSSVLLREEITENLSNEIKVLDDGLHIQLAGNYTSEGGSYVLPTATDRLLLRDMAQKEKDQLKINPVKNGKQPLRCYQYVPEQVLGLEVIQEVSTYMPIFENEKGVTAEMIVNDTKDTAAYVIRSLDCFGRSLIAKEINENAMFSIEPCRTRPNSMSQKIADGEAYFLKPGECATTRCLLGITKDR